MDETTLLRELRQIIQRCDQEGIPVYVVGAFSVKAYDCLERQSFDLDLAVERRFLLELKRVLESLHFAMGREDIWIEARKQVGSEFVALHIAIDQMTDVNTSQAYPIAVEEQHFRRPHGVDFRYPVFSLEGVLITKLLAMRDQDVIDIVSIMTKRGRDLNLASLTSKIIEAELEQELAFNLARLEGMIETGEVDNIWFLSQGTLLRDQQKTGALTHVRKIRSYLEEMLDSLL